jgi:hypothetical protein
MYPKLDLFLFLSSDELRETPTLLGPLERPNLNRWTPSERINKLRVSLPSLEGGNIPSFRDALISSYLEFRTSAETQ